jgi:HEPN domain-containing protein
VSKTVEISTFENVMEYLHAAEQSLNIGELDEAAVNIYNFCTYLLLTTLHKLGVEYPQTKLIRLLIRKVGKTLGREQDFEKFIEENIRVITLIEDVPVRLTVLKRRYSRQEVEEMLQFARKLLELVERG